jgi:uncharacterized lipoprotein YmbA
LGVLRQTAKLEQGLVVVAVAVAIAVVGQLEAGAHALPPLARDAQQPLVHWLDAVQVAAQLATAPLLTQTEPAQHVSDAHSSPGWAQGQGEAVEQTFAPFVRGRQQPPAQSATPEQVAVHLALAPSE